MNKADQHAFVNQILVYTLVMICVSSSVGLGTVWLRHQISVSANRTKVLDARIAELTRDIDERKAAIGRESSPAVLLQRNKEWKLGLEVPQMNRVVRVEDEVLALAAKRNREVFTDVSLAKQVVFRPDRNR